MNSISLGCGLVSIGRKWATHELPLSRQEAAEFLGQAYGLGIRFFDTAPAYGDSEAMLGHFLSGLPDSDRNSITVATKFGEHWNSATNSTYVDHSFAACKKSIDNSLKLLKTINILQLHKAAPPVLKSGDFLRTIDYAREKNIAEFGASISDFESAKIACSFDFIGWIQLPFNSSRLDQERSLDWAVAAGKRIIVNRPVNSGTLLGGNTVGNEVIANLFRKIYEKGFRGYILTGTRNPEHLKQNISAFAQL
jgi:aryl-alcohol dehydrogenase-like predicted oxidoreductase